MKAQTPATPPDFDNGTPKIDISQNVILLRILAMLISGEAVQGKHSITCNVAFPLISLSTSPPFPWLYHLRYP